MASRPGWRWLGVALLWLTIVGAQEAAPVDLEKLRREITILEQIYKLRLTSRQAAGMLPEMAILKQAKDELDAAKYTFWVETSEAAVKIEYALLRGDSPDPKQMDVIDTASRKYRRAKEPLDRKVERAVSSIEAVLTPLQGAMIATPEQMAAKDAALATQRSGREQAVATVVRDLATWARTTPDATYQAELPAKVAGLIALAYPGLPTDSTAVVTQRLMQLYAQVRGMQPRAFNELRPRLDQHVRAALPALPPPGTEDLLMTRAEWLTWLADPLVALLLTKVQPNLPGG